MSQHFIDNHPPGPALLYVHAQTHPGVRLTDDDVHTVTQVDLSAPTEGVPLSADDARRERALYLVDQADGGQA